MTLPHLVYLGSSESPPPAALLHCGKPLEIGARFALERKKSPWNPDWETERVIVGSHPDRADLQLEGPGIFPEHLRIYLARKGPQVEMRSLAPRATWVNGREAAHLEWIELHGGEIIALGPWHFRFEPGQGTPPVD